MLMLHYWIIGGDEKEYGPATHEELCEWISEGRLSSQSQVRAEGSQEWRPLSTFPEFSEDLRLQQARFGPTPSAATPPRMLSTDLLSRPNRVEVGRCLSRSARLLRANFGLFFSASAITSLIGLTEFMPVIGLFYRLLAGVFLGGLCLVMLNRIRGEPATPGMVFAGFGPRMPQLVVVGLLTALLTSVGFALGFLPGIYLLVAWLFSVPLVADKEMDFWPAMRLSRRIIGRVWPRMFVVAGIGFLPVVLLNVYIEIITFSTVTSAMSEAIHTHGYDWSRIFPEVLKVLPDLSKRIFPFLLALKALILLNMPFGLGAILYAYEDLTGPEKSRAT